MADRPSWMADWPAPVEKRGSRNGSDRSKASRNDMVASSGANQRRPENGLGRADPRDGGPGVLLAPYEKPPTVKDMDIVSTRSSSPSRPASRGLRDAGFADGFDAPSVSDRRSHRSSISSHAHPPALFEDERSARKEAPGSSIAEFMDSIMTSPRHTAMVGTRRSPAETQQPPELPLHSSRRPHPTEPNTSWSLDARETPRSDREPLRENSAWRVEEPATMQSTGGSRYRFPTGQVTNLLDNLQNHIGEFNAVQDRHQQYVKRHSVELSWREREDAEVRSRLEEASLQYSHLLSSTPRTKTYINSRRPYESWEQARLRLVLDFPFERLVPQDLRERDLLKQHLAACIADATAVDAARVRILEFRRGSVVVIASIRPDPQQQDLRHPDDLLSILQHAANNPRSELSSVYRLVSAEHARHAETARAAAEGEDGQGGASSPYGFLQRAGQAPAHVTLNMEPQVEGEGTGEGPAEEEEGEERADTRVRGPGGELVDGLLEVVVLEACNLPTAEFTRAFAVLQIESHKSRAGAMLGHHRGREEFEGVGYGDTDGDVTLWGRGEGSTSLAELQASERGHAHRTHVVEGLDPVWARGFRLRVTDRYTEALRVQVLHKGYMATEFIGEVALDVAEVVENAARATADARGPLGWQEERPLLGSPHKANAGPRGYDTAMAELPPGERELEGGPQVAATWFALRTVAGGKVRSRVGTDCELRLGFRWVEGVPPNVKEMRGKLEKQCKDDAAGGGLKWEPRTFWLEPLEQVLRYAIKDVVVGRMSVRGAKAVDATRALAHPHTIEVKTPASSLHVAASNRQEQLRWIDAINEAGAIAKPPPKPPFLVRFKWPLLCCLLLALLVGIALLLYYFVFRRPPGPEPGELAWSLCAGGACASCDCYKRCWFGRTLGTHHRPPLLHHACAAQCACALPPPVGQCGNGVRRDVLVDWYGREVLFEEECDDGNTESGDGCSAACEIESYMMLLEPGMRTTFAYEDGTRSLCGGNHSWTECENACLASDGCGCAWHGGGICHLYPSCEQMTPTFDNLEISWGEVEYRCGSDGPGSFMPDPDLIDIRAAVILFGADLLSDDEQLLFTFALRDTLLDPCSDPCTTTIVAMEPGTLPNSAADDLRRAARSSELTLFGRRSGHDAGMSAGSDDAHAHANATTTPPPGTEDLDVVVVDFKMTTTNESAPAVLVVLRQFVEAGRVGLLGELTEDGAFADLRGVIFSPGGEPAIQPRPAPPPEDGTLFRRRPFSCEPDRYPPFGEHSPHDDVPYLCCGNVSGFCSPPLRCYVSSEHEYDCIAARPPHRPTDVIGVPSDGRADVTWEAPQDTGGFPVTAYRIEKVQFVLNGTGYEIAVPRTPNNLTHYMVDELENFRPYYIRVLAINIIGTGDPSLPSPPLTPSVSAPRAPLHGMGEVGNHRVWLRWDPVAFDGGRQLTGYILEMRNTSGWFRLPLTEDRAITNVRSLSGVYTVPAYDPALIRPSRRLLQAAQTTPAPAPLGRNCSYRGGECDPLSTEFMVVGDLQGDSLVNGIEYQFRLFSANAYSTSRPSDVIAITPSGEPPKEVLNLTAECHDTIQPFQCTSGTGGFTEITVQWLPPRDDSGSPILGYIIAISADGGDFEDVLPEAFNDAETRTYSIVNLTNDVPYHVQVRARNARGNGTVVAIGPVTPRQCLHMEECRVCIEPYYEAWGHQCEPPLCYNLGPPGNQQTRLRDCTPDGCRLEVFYAEEWGTVDGSSTTIVSTDLVCQELGLRPRPVDCGMDACSSKVQPAPAVGTTPYIWLQGITCRGDEPSVHDCPASMRWRTDPATNEYEIGKWYVPLGTHDRDLGICCWAPLPAPPTTTASGGTPAPGATGAAQTTAAGP